MPELNTSHLSIIIPIHNELDNIRPLTRNITAALDGISFELIYVDDGSKDGSSAIIQSIQDHRIILIQLEQRSGQSTALAQGIEIAKGQYILTMDGDMQNDPKDIPKLLELAETQQWDLITGSRINRKDGVMRTIPSLIANAIVRFSTPLRIKDLGCGLKIFNASLAKSLDFYGEQHRYISLIAHLKGAKILETPVTHHPRLYGKSKYNLSRTFRVLGDLIIILLQNKKSQSILSYLSLIGGILLIIGCAIALYLVFLNLMKGSDIDVGGLWVGVSFVFVGWLFYSLGQLYHSRVESFKKYCQDKLTLVKKSIPHHGYS